MQKHQSFFVCKKSLKKSAANFGKKCIEIIEKKYIMKFANEIIKKIRDIF